MARAKGAARGRNPRPPLPRRRGMRAGAPPILTLAVHAPADSAAQLQAPRRAGRGGKGERTAARARGLYLLGCVPPPTRRGRRGGGGGAVARATGRPTRFWRLVRRPRPSSRARPEATRSSAPPGADAPPRLSQAAPTRTTSCSPTGTAPLSAPRTCAARLTRGQPAAAAAKARGALIRVARAAGPRLSQTALGDRIYSLHVHAGPSYPDSPPEVKFITRINMECVDQSTGKVRPPRSTRHPPHARAPRRPGKPRPGPPPPHPVAARPVAQVIPSRLPILQNWKYEYSIKDVLVALRDAMYQASRLSQPPAESTF